MRYKYIGPASGASINGVGEVMLFDGVELELPEDNEYVKTLVALGYLKAITTETKKTKKENTDAS